MIDQVLPPPPSTEELERAPVLDQWKLMQSADDTFVLVGIVSGHPRLKGGWVATSPVQRIDPSDEPRWAETLNRVYRLGECRNA